MLNESKHCFVSTFFSFFFFKHNTGKVSSGSNLHLWVYCQRQKKEKKKQE